MVGRPMIEDALAARARTAWAAWLMCLGWVCSAAPIALAQPQSANCAVCHSQQAKQFDDSVHHGVVPCQECHGGEKVYELSPEAWQKFVTAPTTNASGAIPPAPFDHGKSFRGKSSRVGVPVLCGTCHSDVERMNPYGLRTDQLSSYQVSGHGKRLKQYADDRVAVCIDCHGIHDILRSSNPQSRTFARNVPQTCGRCHGDQNLMQNYNLPADIPDQYKKSVHGRNLLEKGDIGSPHCATCHGNHAAAPPGFLEVGHVCGKCHKQIEEYFMTSVHGRIPVMARCIGCHAKGGQRWNHQIEEASPPVEKLVEAFAKVRAEVGDHPDILRERFLGEVDARSGSMSFSTVCMNCHAPGRQGPHASFFLTSDQMARETGKELATSLREAQFEYAKTTERVARLARGVVLVKNEALRIEDAKTELMALYAFLHSLDRPEIQTRVQATKNICREVNTDLDQKESSLTIRRVTVLPVWIFIVCFCILMYQKYRALKHAYVLEAASGLPATAPPTGSMVSTGRRRALDAILTAMGAISAIALLWPAVSYVLPVRKRGGGGERVSAGKQEGWAVWDGRKVSLQGKPAVVIRTDSGFRAFSAVCTHLGCIVQWNSATRDFECPCHAAKFNADGQIVSGPPPRPLPQYGVSVVQNEVIVKDA